MNKAEVGIYAFTSKVNGFCYVGQSINLAKRKREHLKDLRNGNHHAIYLQRHYKAHGVECLDYKVLEFCTPDDLTAREQFWMMEFEATGSFNSIPASDSAKGFSPTAETRLKISIAGKGKKRSGETKALMKITNARPVSKQAIEKMIATRKANRLVTPTKKPVYTEEGKARLIAALKTHVISEAGKLRISAASTGRIFSEESKQKMRESGTGRVTSEESKAKISAANKGRKRTPEMCARMSEQRKGIPISEETKLKLSAAGKGKVKTPEHMAKISATRLRNKLASQQ